MNSHVVVIGKESVGKSQLIASLTGQSAYVANFRGSTVSCAIYPTDSFVFVDTPGMLFHTDSETTKTALTRVQTNDTVLLVAQATHLDDDLADLLPLTKGKRGAVAVTFWDKIQADDRTATLARLSATTGVPFIPLDARRVGSPEREQLLRALTDASLFTPPLVQERVGWRVEARSALFERRGVGALLALTLLLLPAFAAVWSANTFAAVVESTLQAFTASWVKALQQLPSVFAALLIGRYGFLTMGPLLFVWAAPTVVSYAFLLAVYKESGLLDRLTEAVHPFIRPFGLSGRDLVRVMMGYGCNVPAVISTRACSSCTRTTCISTIAFGSACSYQLGATIGVFAALGHPALLLPYLLLLTTTALVYARFVSSPEARSAHNQLMIVGRSFLVWPGWSAVWREARGTLSQFFGQAIPIFFAITAIASLLDWLGALPSLASLLSPTMALFRLPAQAALPVLLASIRKDGILLFTDAQLAPALSSLQILTGVYLAGVLLPCLVTTLTIAREQSWRFACRLLLQQSGAAIVFALFLAWGGAFLGL